MSKPSELDRIAHERGISVPELLKETLESAGSIEGAADVLSKDSAKPIFPNTVRYGLRKYNLRFFRETIGRVESAEVPNV